MNVTPATSSAHGAGPAQEIFPVPCRNALVDEVGVAVAVLDSCHVVKLGIVALDEVWRQVQHENLGHRGRSGDPVYGIRNVLRCGTEQATDRQKARLEPAFDDERHDEVEVAGCCARQLRASPAASPPRRRPTTQAGQ